MAREVIYAEIDLCQIPPSAVEEYIRANGEKAAKVRICISEMKRPDMYCNTHCLFLYRSKAQAEAGVPIRYIGSGHYFRYNYAKQLPDEKV